MVDEVSTTYKQAVFTNRSALSFTGHFDDDFHKRASFKFIKRVPFAGSVPYRRSIVSYCRDGCSPWLRISGLFSLNMMCGWVVDERESERKVNEERHKRARPEPRAFPFLQLRALLSGDRSF